MQKDLGNLIHCDDTALVRAAQQGDHSAFSELVRRHRAGCLRLALSVVQAREDAEDEVQNAFCKAWEHLARFQQDAKFSTWLYRIVLNQCLMRLRQTRRSRLQYLDDGHTADETATTLEARAPGRSPEALTAEREVAGVLHREVQRIPPLLRHAFVLRDLYELPMPDVAQRLGISVAAAKSRLLRARAELKERLGKHCGRLGPATLLAEF